MWLYRKGDNTDTIPTLVNFDFFIGITALCEYKSMYVVSILKINTSYNLLSQRKLNEKN